MRSTNLRLYDLLEFIDDCQQRDYRSPSIREMCDYIGVKSTCTIAYYIKKLGDLELLSKENLKSRALKILQPKDKWPEILKISPNNLKSTSFNINKPINTETISIPLLGKVTAGMPIFAHEEFIDTYSLPYNLFNQRELFMLNVKGESMINAGIFDGDKIIVKKQNTAENGEIIVALLEDSATVKRFYKENGHYRLQPENDSMSPIICENVEILGKVIGLIRNIK